MRFGTVSALLVVIITLPGLVMIILHFMGALKEKPLVETQLVTNDSQTVEESASEDSSKNYSCYEQRSKYEKVRSEFHFWVEGVGVFVIGVFGIVGNTIYILVLRKSERTNANFNKLLIALGIVDTLFILDLVLEMSLMRVLVGTLEKEPQWYVILFSHLIHPLRGMLQTSTIFMIVAVCTERYRAICFPFSHRKSWYKVSIEGMEVTHLNSQVCT